MIYLAIVCVGLFSSIADSFLFKSRIKVYFMTVVYAIIYYCVTVFARVIFSNSSDYLSFSFLNKGSRAYIKAMTLMLMAYFVLVIMRILIARMNAISERSLYSQICYDDVFDRNNVYCFTWLAKYVPCIMHGAYICMYDRVMVHIREI